MPDPLNQPTDAGDDVPPCVVLTPDGGPLVVDLGLTADVQIADLFFLIDVTGSMNDEIENIQARLQDTIVPGIAARIPDVAFGVAVFADFPVELYGQSGLDTPFQLQLPISRDLVAVQGALDGLPRLNGQDGPESQVEALFLTATGEGVSWPSGPGWSGGSVPASAGCPSGGNGYACFRRDALPLIILFSDAPFHNGSTGGEPYGGWVPNAHGYLEAVDALVALGVRVIGINSGGWYNGREDLMNIARDTGTVDSGGSPLVFDIAPNGYGLGEQVVNAVNVLANDVRMDVDAYAQDVPGDAVDTRQLITSIRPLGAEPASGFARSDETTFYGVQPGTRLFFSVEIQNNGVVTPGPTAQRYPVRIVFRGDGRFRLGARQLDIVIGPDGTGLCGFDAGS